MSVSSTHERIVEYASQFKGIDCDVLRDGLELTHLHRTIEHLVEDYLADWGLNLRLVEIMECLFHQEGGVMTPADLATAVDLSRSAMTWALDSLEKLGYAVRQAHPTDRRMFEISLTESGQAFIKSRLGERYQKYARIMSVLTESDRSFLLQAYTKIINALQAELQ